MLIPLLAVLALPHQGDGSLRPGDVDDLVEEYVALDGKSGAGVARQDEILAQLQTLEPLSASSAKSWRKKIAKLWSKGPTLEKKSGRRYLWEDDKRGLYIVGGEARRPKGLFIGMHGGGEGSGDAGTSHGVFNAAVSKMEWVGIFPEVLEKTEHGWTDSGTEEFVIELVERALRTWKLDRDKVFFGGHSMGGYGTWTLGAHHADLVAGLTPSAGAPTPIMSGGEIVDIDWGIVPNLRNVAMVVYQSDDDPRVPPGPNRKAAELIAKAREEHGGYDFEYWEETKRAHDPPPGGMKALLEKIQDRVRNPHPDKVLWQPMLAWKRQFYWLWWERPVQGALIEATVDAEKREVRVKCDKGGKGLFVLLSDAMMDIDEEVAVFFCGEEVFRGVPERSLVALVSTGTHGDAERTYDARIALVR